MDVKLRGYVRGLQSLKEPTAMPWCKFFLSGIGLSLSVAAAQATTVCPQYPTQQDKTHALNDASLFVGPPKDLVELMPDNDRETVWTLPDYQDEAKEHKRRSILYATIRTRRRASS
jgi:hypothetical protein